MASEVPFVYPSFHNRLPTGRAPSASRNSFKLSSIEHLRGAISAPRFKAFSYCSFDFLYFTYSELRSCSLLVKTRVSLSCAALFFFNFCVGAIIRRLPPFIPSVVKELLEFRQRATHNMSFLKNLVKKRGAFRTPFIIGFLPSL